MTIDTRFLFRAVFILLAILVLPVSPTLAGESSDDTGEASYNVENCEPSGKDGESKPRQKDLDDCKGDTK